VGEEIGDKRFCRAAEHRFQKPANKRSFGFRRRLGGRVSKDLPSFARRSRPFWAMRFMVVSVVLIRITLPKDDLAPLQRSWRNPNPTGREESAILMVWEVVYCSRDPR